MKTWFDVLVEQYADEKHDLERYRQSLDRTDLSQKIESQTVSGMISDLQFSLTWMRKGRRPGSLRGIDRQKIYQRTAIGEMLRPEEKLKLLDLLLSMSDRERQCFLLHMAQGLTHEEIADRLKVSKGTVQTFLKRAKRKVQKEI
ncbi:sigma-70 family RNA polymerase sigma factor [Ferviditalea candida]|uniref:Sigma-70 family RNA polymerase sigma factor n=1 Tax=Ferviditalea candida TaxID=3108399 RepID=A0ABU5ZN14_9BACL|nr:sigma-70 family RNA polymerase sigma factor [Paenibacillaceae bacterium T2]